MLSKQTALKAIVMMLFATLFFAFKPILGRIAIEHGLAPLPLVTIRLMVAFPLFVMTVALMRRERELFFSAGELALTGAVSIFGMSGAMLFSFYSIKYLGASISTLIIFIFPAITAMFARMVYGEPITRLKRWSLAISFLGIAFVIAPLGIKEMHEIRFFSPGKGVLFALLAAFCWAGTQVSFQKIMERKSPLILTTYTTGIMLVFFMAINGFPSFNLEKEALVSVVLLGTFGWYAPFLLALSAIRIIGASRSAIIQSLGPGLTVFIAWAGLGERLDIVQLAGMLLLIIAVYLVKNDAEERFAVVAPAPGLKAEPLPVAERAGERQSYL